MAGDSPTPMTWTFTVAESNQHTWTRAIPVERGVVFDSDDPQDAARWLRDDDEEASP